MQSIRQVTTNLCLYRVFFIGGRPLSRIHKYQGQSHDLSRDALLVYLFSRRYLAEKSTRNHCNVNRADFSPISWREIGDFSPRNHCNVNRALLFMLLCLQADFSTVDSPKIVQGPVDKKVQEHSVVSFFCKAIGHPTPDIYWHRGGKRIGASHYRYTIINMPQGSVLRIDSAKSRRDNVTFECVADNGIGESANASAKLEVYSEGNGECATLEIHSLLTSVRSDQTRHQIIRIFWHRKQSTVFEISRFK